VTGTGVAARSVREYSYWSTAIILFPRFLESISVKSNWNLVLGLIELDLLRCRNLCCYRKTDICCCLTLTREWQFRAKQAEENQSTHRDFRSCIVTFTRSRLNFEIRIKPVIAPRSVGEDPVMSAPQQYHIGCGELCD
jgi:hypothetical protein